MGYMVFIREFEVYQVVVYVFFLLFNEGVVVDKFIFFCFGNLIKFCFNWGSGIVNIIFVEVVFYFQLQGIFCVQFDGFDVKVFIGFYNGVLKFGCFISIDVKFQFVGICIVGC